MKLAARSGIRVVKPQGTNKYKRPKAGACRASSKNNANGAGTDVARLRHTALVPNK